jgi:hypothetical protein
MTKVRHTLLGAAVVCSFAGALSNAAFAACSPTPQQRSACMSDVMGLCSHAIPNMDQICACLIANRAQLSPSCQAQFAKVEKKGNK